MLTFRMDETNFDQGTRDGLRIAEGPGLKVDFDEFAPDGATLGLWHLHDGACAGEGTGLADASGNGHDLTNHGADSIEDGYRFVQADHDYLTAPFPSQPSRGTLTLEAWVRDWVQATTAYQYIYEFRHDANNRMFLAANRNEAAPATSDLVARLYVGGTSVGYLVWQGQAVYDLLGAAGPWHAALAFDAAEGWFRLFVNGVLRAQDTTGIAALPAQDYALNVGAYAGGTIGWLSGVIDEVRLSAAARYASNFTPHRLLASGTFASPTFDADRLQADWTNLDPDATVPPGCEVGWEVRAADETDGFGDPQALWQAWSGDPETLPDGQYFQWRASLSADDDRLASPAVASVEAVASEAGYNLYHAAGDGPDALDYAEPWRRVGPAATEADTEALAADAVHWFGVRPVDADGRESPTTQHEARLELDADGEAVPDRPAAPLALAADPLPLGQVRLRWRYRIGAGGVVPQVFRVFGDGGTGTFDYDTPLGETPFVPGQAWYTWTGGPLTGVPHQLAVRAVAAGEVWDETAAVASVTPDAAPPAAVDALTAEVLP